MWRQRDSFDLANIKEQSVGAMATFSRMLRRNCSIATRTLAPIVHARGVESEIVGRCLPITESRLVVGEESMLVRDNSRPQRHPKDDLCRRRGSLRRGPPRPGFLGCSTARRRQSMLAPSDRHAPNRRRFEKTRPGVFTRNNSSPKVTFAARADPLAAALRGVKSRPMSTATP